jgi:hypothetical protein
MGVDMFPQKLRSERDYVLVSISGLIIGSIEVAPGLHLSDPFGIFSHPSLEKLIFAKKLNERIEPAVISFPWNASRRVGR